MQSATTTGRIEGSAINDVIGSVLEDVGASHKEKQAILRGIIGQQRHPEVSASSSSWEGNDNKGKQSTSDPLFYELADTLEEEEEKLLNQNSDWISKNEITSMSNKNNNNTNNQTSVLKSTNESTSLTNKNNNNDNQNSNDHQEEKFNKEASEISKKFTDSKIKALFQNKHNEDTKKANEESKSSTQSSGAMNSEHIIKHILDHYGAAEKFTLDGDDDESKSVGKFRSGSSKPISHGGITEKIFVLPTDKINETHNNNNTNNSDIKSNTTTNDNKSQVEPPAENEKSTSTALKETAKQRTFDIMENEIEERVRGGEEEETAMLTAESELKRNSTMYNLNDNLRKTDNKTTTRHNATFHSSSPSLQPEAVASNSKKDSLLPFSV